MIGSAPAAVEDVRGCAHSCGQCAEEQVEPSEDLLVAVVGSGVVGVDAVGEFTAVTLVEGGEFFVEGHALRVAPVSLWEIVLDVWSGLPLRDRQFWSALLPLGCLFFLILGAVLR